MRAAAVVRGPTEVLPRWLTVRVVDAHVRLERKLGSGGRRLVEVRQIRVVYRLTPLGWLTVCLKILSDSLVPRVAPDTGLGLTTGKGNTKQFI